jgi:hypothetical protein
MIGRYFRLLLVGALLAVAFTVSGLSPSFAADNGPANFSPNAVGFEGGGSTSPVLACCGGSTGTLPVLACCGGSTGTLPVLAFEGGGGTLPVSTDGATSATPAGGTAPGVQGGSTLPVSTPAGGTGGASASATNGNLACDGSGSTLPI